MHTHCRLALSPGGWEIAGVHVCHLLNGLAQPGGQKTFAFKRQRFRVLGKFVPDFHLAFCAVAHAANAARLQRRVEPRKIGKFQRD